jgi:hypothetical protein
MELVQLAAPVGRLDAVAFSPDGATLATLSVEQGQVTLWSAADGALVRSFFGQPADAVWTQGGRLAFSPDGTLLASADGNIFDPTTGEVVARFDVVGNREGTVRRMTFSPDGGHLVVDRAYQIGNSPPTTVISLIDILRCTGGGSDPGAIPLSPATVLYEAYGDYLRSAAVAADGSRVALAKASFTQEPGLRVFRTADGAEVSDPTFAGVALGFSRDSRRLFTVTDDGTLVVRDATDLHELGHVAWPYDDGGFRAVSPGDELVVSTGGETSWLDPVTGAVRRTLPRAIRRPVWTDDGLIGAAVDDDALFAVWREADAGALCAPPKLSEPAPALDSLGTTFPAGYADDATATSDDGTVTATRRFVLHAHATNYYSIEVTATASGEALRRFSPIPDESRQIAIGRPDGRHLYTPEGGAVAGWCD